MFNSLGDHLRKVRLDRGFSQPDIARLVKVTTETVTGWELNRHEPPAKSAKAIIDFLGYIPFEIEGSSIGKQLYYARLITGKTQRQVAEMISCDASNLKYIESDQRKPFLKTREKIEWFVEGAFKGSLQ